jgi:transposase
VAQGEVDGAAEALGPVLALPPAQRDHTIVTSVERVRTALSAITDSGRDAIALAGAIEAFTAERLTQPR